MKGSIVAASAALLGSVAASAHNAHNGFHLRRNPAAEEVCTVYTTIYVYPSDVPTLVFNVSAGVYAPTGYSAPVLSSTESVPCTEETSSTPIPIVASSTSSSTVVIYTPAPTPSSSSSVEAYTPAPLPSSSKEVYTPAPVPSSSSEAQPSKEAYTPAPVYVSSAVYSAPAYSAPAVHSEKPKPSKPAETPSYSGGSGSYAGTGRIVTKGNKWGITYTPYTEEGDCKSAGEVKSDIAKIAEMGFTTIRSYSTDCGVFENVVPEAQSHGLKIIYGIFIEAGGAGGKGVFSSYANDQLQEIISSAPKDSVAMIIAGNEAMFNGYVEASELASYLDYIREQLHSAGFPKDIAVTTTEPVGTWEEKGAELCDHIDIFTVQVHPFFTDSVFAYAAGDFAKEQLEQAAKVCPEAAAKGKYITEIGWPTSGEANGNAVPGYSEQKVAMKTIMEKVGTQACLFSFQNDNWKAPGAFGVEQHFGVAGSV